MNSAKFQVRKNTFRLLEISFAFGRLSLFKVILFGMTPCDRGGKVGHEKKLSLEVYHQGPQTLNLFKTITVLFATLFTTSDFILKT